MRLACLFAAALGLIALAPERALAAEATVTIPVEGVGCASCTLAVRRALKKLEGVKAIGPGARENQAVVTYDDSKVSPDQMVEAIDSIGFKAGTPIKG